MDENLDSNRFEKFVQVYASHLDRLMLTIERRYGSAMVRVLLYELFIRLEMRHTPALQPRVLDNDMVLMHSIDCELSLLKRTMRAVDIFLSLYSPFMSTSDLSDLSDLSSASAPDVAGARASNNPSIREDPDVNSNDPYKPDQRTSHKPSIQMDPNLPSSSNATSNVPKNKPNKKRRQRMKKKQKIEAMKNMCSVSVASVSESCGQADTQPSAVEPEQNEENLEGAAVSHRLLLIPSEREFLEESFTCTPEQVMQIVGRYLPRYLETGANRAEAYIDLANRLRLVCREHSSSPEQEEDAFADFDRDFFNDFEAAVNEVGADNNGHSDGSAAMEEEIANNGLRDEPPAMEEELVNNGHRNQAEAAEEELANNGVGNHYIVMQLQLAPNGDVQAAMEDVNSNDSD